MKTLTLILLMLATFARAQGIRIEPGQVVSFTTEIPLGDSSLTLAGTGHWVVMSPDGVENWSSNITYDEAENEWCWSYPNECRAKYEVRILRIKLSICGGGLTPLPAKPFTTLKRTFK